MKKLIFYFIATIFIIPLLNGQIDSKYELNETKTESLFFIDETKTFIADYFGLQTDNRDWLTIFLKLNDANYHKLSDSFELFLSKYDNKSQRAIKKKIDIWYKISILINFPYDLDETELLETLEIISELEQTKKFVDQFIVVEGQYWGSLSTGQGTEVYFEMMEYLFNLSDREKLKFFRDYYNLAYEKGV